MYFIPQTAQLIFGGLNINNKYCSTFTFMYLGENIARRKNQIKCRLQRKKERLAGQRQTQISFLVFNGNTPYCAAFFTARQKREYISKAKK
jgi:hypothetical protein